MKNTTYWKPRKIFNHCHCPHLIEALKNCNLSESDKIALLAKVASYDSKKENEDCYIRETIMNTLIENNKPMRVMDFIKEENAPLHKYTAQRVNAQMQNLFCAGVINRFEKETDKKIEVAPDYFVSEIITYFEIRG